MDQIFSRVDKTFIIYRFGEPSKLDTADYGTICKVAGYSADIKYYIQISSDSSNPRWEKLDTKIQKEAIAKSQELLNIKR